MRNLGLSAGIGAMLLVLGACEEERRPVPAKAPASTPAPAAPAPAPAPAPAQGTPAADPPAAQPEPPSTPPEKAAPAAPDPQPGPGAVLKQIETDSGLIIEELRYGEGAEAQPFDTVTVNYVGTLADGREFDRSAKPVTFMLTQVVKAWQEGVPGMKVGGKRRLIVPPELGYGSRGSPPKIPPDAMLIFEIELVDLPE